MAKTAWIQKVACEPGFLALVKDAHACRQSKDPDLNFSDYVRHTLLQQAADDLGITHEEALTRSKRRQGLAPTRKPARKPARNRS
jgi:hypothetical protein